MRTGRQYNPYYGVGTACRLLCSYQLTGFVLWPRYLGTTGLGLLRVTVMWIIDSLMYNGLLVRISIMVSQTLFGAVRALLVSTCPAQHTLPALDAIG